ncbi:MAG: hypothetical protein P1S60_05455 [Anaerolineae bacterium]|nr:hypothetical protein [Anaerolineae bacterium]
MAACAHSFYEVHTGMKTIALIGDSIRMGYAPVVESILVNQAHIWEPAINGGDSRHIHHQNKPFDRLEEDVLAYNAAALGIALSLGIPVNDLYVAVMEAGRDQLLVADGVHFSTQGYQLLGESVAVHLQPYLG